MSWEPRTPQEYRAVARLRDRGLVRMAATGQWEATPAADDLLAELNALLALMGRPGSPLPSAPRRRAQAGRKSGPTTPPSGAPRRDDPERPRRRGRKG